MKKNKGYRHILVVNGKISRYGWCLALKMKTDQTITNEFPNNVPKSNGEPSSIEQNCWKKIVTKIRYRFDKW